MVPNLGRLGARVVILLTCLVGVACSGSPENNLLAGGGDHGDSGGSMSDAPMPPEMVAGDATVPADGRGVAEGAAGSRDERADSPPEGGFRDGTAGDAAAATTDAAAATDAAGDNSSTGVAIPCGNARCSVQGEFCCVSAGGVQSCSANMDGCLGQNGTPVSCTTSSQCPTGQVCCGEQHNSYYAEVSCQLDCNSSSNGISQVQFCDPNAPDCPPNDSCQASVYLIGFSVCE